MIAVGSIPEPEAQGRTVLVVEDQFLIRHALAEELRQCGLRAVEAASADEALVYLRSGERVDLVFSDVQMPGTLDGLELARQLRIGFPELRVLLTSGRDLAPDQLEGAPFVRKPYDETAVARRIEALLSVRSDD